MKTKIANILKHVSWEKVIKILLILSGILEILQIWKLYQEPQLAQIFMVVLLLIFVGAFGYGYYTIRSSNHGKTPKYRMGKITYILLICLILGFAIAYSVLFFLRPSVSDKIQSDNYEIKKEQGYQLLKSFDVKYSDHYYLSLKIDNQYPVTFQLLDEKGNEIFSNMAMKMNRKAIKLKLDKGTYELHLSFASEKYQSSKVNMEYDIQ